MLLPRACLKPATSAATELGMRLIQQVCLAALLAVCGCDGETNGEPNTGGNGGSAPEGGGAPSTISTCDRFIACTSEVQPESTTAAEAAYGADGACWTTESAEACKQACVEGLAALHQIEPDSQACAVCTADADCSGATPACSVERGECVACTSADDCQGTTPACDAATNSCVECASDSDCAGPLGACEPEGHTCVECKAGSDCESGSCEADNTCCVVEDPCGVDSCGSVYDNCGNSVSCGGCDAGDYCETDSNTCQPISTTFECSLNGVNNTCPKYDYYCQYYFAGPGSTAWCEPNPAECVAQPTCACLLAASEYYPPGDECEEGSGPNGDGAIYITSTP